MNRAGVAEAFSKIRQHGVEDGGVHGRSRVVIEIDAHVEGLRVFRIAVRVGGVKQRPVGVAQGW